MEKEIVNCIFCNKEIDLFSCYYCDDNDQAYCSEECLSAHEAEGLSRAED